MVARIESLTDEHRATFPAWEAKWLEHGLRTGPLTEAEWDRVAEAALRTAEFSGLPRPLLIRCGSPLAAAIAAPVAAFVAATVARRSGVESGVWSGVESGVGSGYAEWLHEPIAQGLRHAASTWAGAWIGGNLWSGELAFLSWFRDHGHLDLAGDLWDRLAAYEGICGAGPSFWHRFGDITVAAFSDRPTEIHRDPQGNSHRDDGPAIVYADGWTLNLWHGVSVPDDFFAWDLDRALAEDNAEVRRCAIERIGWEQVTDRLTLVAAAPDPGNPGHDIALYDLPAELQLYDDRARLLVVHNASLDKGGHRRTFGLPVPASHADPIAAAADLFGIPAAAYAATARAS